MVLERKILLLVPMLLGLFLYLNMYFGSLFSGREYFNVFAIVVQVLQIYLYWFMVTRVFDKSKIRLMSAFVLSVLIVTFTEILINSSIKLLLIEFAGQNDALKLLHLLNYSAHGVLTGIAVSLLVMLIRAVSLSQQAAIENAELKRANARAQLLALQTQVNPHFLFNNLNTLQSLIDTDNLPAQQFLKNLSDLFRQMLHHKDEQLVPLSDEVEFAQRFCHLLEQRFSDNLTVEFFIKDEQHYQLPPFTLQLLIENVIKHNRLDEKHPLHCSIVQHQDSLAVSNNIQVKREQAGASGMGLENLTHRYALLSDRTLNVVQQDGRFCVTVPLLKVVNYD